MNERMNGMEWNALTIDGSIGGRVLFLCGLLILCLLWLLLICWRRCCGGTCCIGCRCTCTRMLLIRRHFHTVVARAFLSIFLTLYSEYLCLSIYLCPFVDGPLSLCLAAWALTLARTHQLVFYPFFSTRHTNTHKHTHTH